MPYELNWESAGVHKRLFGHVTPPELHESGQRLAADARFDATRFIINDYSGVQSHTLTPDDFDEVAALQLGAYATNPNVLVVYVTTDEALAQMVRHSLMQPPSASYEVIVVPDMAQARECLAQRRQGTGLVLPRRFGRA